MEKKDNLSTPMRSTRLRVELTGLIPFTSNRFKASCATFCIFTYACAPTCIFIYTITEMSMSLQVGSYDTLMEQSLTFIRVSGYNLNINSAELNDSRV